MIRGWGRNGENLSAVIVGVNPFRFYDAEWIQAIEESDAVGLLRCASMTGASINSG